MNAPSEASLEPQLRPGLARALVLLTAIVAGGLVAWLGQYGAIPQTALVLAMGVGAPALLLFLARPHSAVAAYLFVLPLIVPVTIVGGMNGGEALTLLIMVLGSLTLWSARDRLGDSLARLRPVLFPLAALILVSLVSLMVNEIFRFEEVASALLKFVAFALVPLLVHVHAPTVRHARGVLLGSLLGGAAVAIYTMVAYLAGWTYSAEYDWNRPMGTFENWNLLGACMALVSLPTLGFAMASRGGRRWLFGVLFVLEVVVLMLSLTLGSMLGLVVGAVVLLLMTRPRWSRVAPVLTLVLLAMVVAVAATPELRYKMSQFEERVDDRLRTYITGAMMFRDKFWWGFGSEQNMAAELLGGEADYAITSLGGSPVVPHNAFLKVAAEKGVFGLLAFTALVIGSLHVLLRRRRLIRSTPEAALYYGIVGGTVAFLVQNMTNDLLQHARLGIIFFALIAIVDRFSQEADPA